ncbi:MAG: ABC transporter substrate-binding protein [Betaproteobacteria bacterium]|nr:ABC transporter substrate-binding protein [Betaproteobacteria bacterium]
MRLPAAERSLAGLLKFLAAGALLASAATATAQDVAPDVLVKNVTLEVIEIITKDKDIKAGDQRKVIDLVELKVLPHFNFGGMTALAMGQSWKQANAEQKKRLIEEFRTLLVRTYSSALSAYSDQKFEFRPLRAKPTDTDVTVNVRVLQPGAQAVTIDYDMEKTPGGWKVYNVYVAGVSLVQNYRTDFANQVRDTGIDGLIKTLQSKNKSLEQRAAASTEKK